MAGWNGSDRKGAAPVQPKVTAKKPSPIRGIVAGLVVVAAACAAYFVFFSGSEKPQKVVEQKKPTAIKEVTPAAAPKPDKDPGPEMIRNRRGELVPKIVEKTYVDERGILRYEGGARVYSKERREKAVKTVITSHDSGLPKFNHTCESEIATLLTVEPGDMLHGMPDYGESFKKDFIQALMEPIQINEDDSDEDKALKKLVEEQKHDLAKRIREGEDLATILSETREEVRRLAEVKDEIIAFAREAERNPDISDEEVGDYYAAANKMLESKGLAPVKVDGIMKSRAVYFKRMASKKNRKAEQQ